MASELGTVLKSDELDILAPIQTSGVDLLKNKMTEGVPELRLGAASAATRAVDMAVPRRPEPVPLAPIVASDPQAEMLLRADQKNKSNMLDWAALKEWLNKAGTGDEIEHAWNMFKAGGKDWYEGGIGRALGGDGKSSYGLEGMKYRLEVQKTLEEAKKSKASQSGEKK